MSDSTKVASKRGRKPVKGGEFVCVVCDNSLGFQTKKELTDHTNKVHRFVQCGGCEPKKIITYSSYKQTHIKSLPQCKQIPPIPWNKLKNCAATWSLPEDATNLSGTEITPNCDNHNQTDITTAGADEDESQNENVEEDDDVDVNSEEDDHEDFHSSALSTGTDGTCDVDEALSVAEMKKFDRMRTKRQIEFTEGSPKRKRSDKSVRRDPKSDAYEVLPIVNREIQVLPESSPIQPTQVICNVGNEASHNLIHAMQIQYDQLSICDVDLYWKTITQTSQEQMKTFKVCRNIMTMWKCWSVNQKRDEMIIRSQFTVSTDVLTAILCFLHTGRGIRDAKMLLEILNSKPDELVSFYVVVTLIHCSLTAMETTEIPTVISNITCLQSAKFREVTKLCLLLTIMCSSNLRRILPFSSILRETNEFHGRFCSDGFDTCTSLNCRKTMRTLLLHEIMEFVEKTTEREVFHTRSLEFSMTAERTSFQFKLLSKCFSADTDNILEHVFLLNLDPFCSELDENFTFLVENTNDQISMHVHEIVMRLRLQISVDGFGEIFSRIRAELKIHSFSRTDVFMFWRFLYSDERPISWEKNCAVGKLIQLSFIFEIPKIPLFLFGSNPPKTPKGLRCCVECYLMCKDFKNLGRICVMFQEDATLMGQLQTEQVYDLFVNDEMPLPELDVYELIVKFAQAKPCNDETDDYKTFQARFQKLSAVIRFGLMTKEEFDKVDDDGYLDSKHCSSFSYNIKWQKVKSRMTEVPEYFMKPFEARCDKIMTG
ncbi:unnamed protein product [Orchesella dallaii]|uniref:Uncharacterized protein n=1 Tax=Orchesella dallaii TaxID=48710 RepID=A0ABP1PSM2_9HEXA